MVENTVKLKQLITEKSFRVPARTDRPQTQVTVIDLIDRQIINKRLIATLPCVNGEILADPVHDILKLAIVERYGKLAVWEWDLYGALASGRGLWPTPCPTITIISW